MYKYKVWKNENIDYEFLVEIFNDCDVLNVQKEFVNNGYIIREYFKGAYHTFIRVYSADYYIRQIKEVLENEKIHS